MNHRKISKRKNVITQSRKKTLGNSKIGKGQSKNIRFYSKKKKKYSQKINQKGGTPSPNDDEYILDLGVGKEPKSFYGIYNESYLTPQKNVDNANRSKNGTETTFIENNGVEISKKLLYLKLSENSFKNHRNFLINKNDNLYLNYREESKKFVDFLWDKLEDYPNILLELNTNNYFCPGIQNIERTIDKDGNESVKKHTTALSKYLAADNTCICVENGQDGNFILVTKNGEENIRMTRLPNMFVSDEKLKIKSPDDGQQNYTLVISKTHLRWKESFDFSSSLEKIDDSVQFLDVNKVDGISYWKIKNVKIKSIPVDSFSKKEKGNSFLSHLVIEFKLYDSNYSNDDFEVYLSVDSSDEFGMQKKPPLVSLNNIELISQNNIISSVTDFLFQYRKMRSNHNEFLIYPDGNEDSYLIKIRNILYRHRDKNNHIPPGDFGKLGLNFSNPSEAITTEQAQEEVEKKSTIISNLGSIASIASKFDIFGVGDGIATVVKKYFNGIMNIKKAIHREWQGTLQSSNLSEVTISTTDNVSETEGLGKIKKKNISDYVTDDTQIREEIENQEEDLFKFKDDYTCKLQWSENKSFLVMKRLITINEEISQDGFEQTYNFTNRNKSDLEKEFPNDVLKDRIAELAYFNNLGHRLTFKSFNEGDSTLTVEMPYLQYDSKGLVIKKVITKDEFARERLAYKDVRGHTGDLVFYSGKKNNCVSRHFSSEEKPIPVDPECRELIRELNPLRGEPAAIKFIDSSSNNNTDKIIPWLITDDKPRIIDCFKGAECPEKDMAVIKVSTWEKPYVYDSKKKYFRELETIKENYLGWKRLIDRFIYPITGYNFTSSLLKRIPFSAVYWPQKLVNLGLWYRKKSLGYDGETVFVLNTNTEEVFSMGSLYSDDENNNQVNCRLKDEIEDIPTTLGIPGSSDAKIKESLSNLTYSDKSGKLLLTFRSYNTRNSELVLEKKNTEEGYVGLSAKRPTGGQNENFVDEYLKPGPQFPQFTVSLIVDNTYNLKKYSASVEPERIVVYTSSGLYWITGTNKVNSTMLELDIYYIQIFEGDQEGEYRLGEEIKIKRVSLKRKWFRTTAPTIMSFLKEMGWVLLPFQHDKKKIPTNEKSFTDTDGILKPPKEAEQKSKVEGVMEDTDRELIISLVNNNTEFKVIPADAKFIQVEKLFDETPMDHPDIPIITKSYPFKSFMNTAKSLQDLDKTINGQLTKYKSKNGPEQDYYTMYKSEEGINVLSTSLMETKTLNLKQQGGGREIPKKKKKTLIGGSLGIEPISEDVNSIISILETFSKDYSISQKPTFNEHDNIVGLTKNFTQSCRFIEGRIKELTTQMSNVFNLVDSYDNITKNAHLIMEQIKTNKNSKKRGTIKSSLNEVFLGSSVNFDSPFPSYASHHEFTGEPGSDVSSFPIIPVNKTHQEFCNNELLTQTVKDNPLYYIVNVSKEDEKRQLTFQLQKPANLERGNYELEIYMNHDYVGRFTYNNEDSVDLMSMVVPEVNIKFDDPSKTDSSSILDTQLEIGLLFRISTESNESMGRYLGINEDMFRLFMTDHNKSKIKKHYSEIDKVNERPTFSLGLGNHKSEPGAKTFFEESEGPEFTPDKIEDTLTKIREDKADKLLLEQGFTNPKSLLNRVGLSPAFEGHYYGEKGDNNEQAKREIILRIGVGIRKEPEMLTRVFNTESEEKEGLVNKLIKQLKATKKGESLEEEDGDVFSSDGESGDEESGDEGANTAPQPLAVPVREVTPALASKPVEVPSAPVPAENVEGNVGAEGAVIPADDGNKENFSDAQEVQQEVQPVVQPVVEGDVGDGGPADDRDEENFSDAQPEVEGEGDVGAAAPPSPELLKKGIETGFKNMIGGQFCKLNEDEEKKKSFFNYGKVDVNGTQKNFLDFFNDCFSKTSRETLQKDKKDKKSVWLINKNSNEIYDISYDHFKISRGGTNWYLDLPKLINTKEGFLGGGDYKVPLQQQKKLRKLGQIYFIKSDGTIQDESNNQYDIFIVREAQIYILIEIMLEIRKQLLEQNINKEEFPFFLQNNAFSDDGETLGKRQEELIKLIFSELTTSSGENKSEIWIEKPEIVKQIGLKSEDIKKESPKGQFIKELEKYGITMPDGPRSIISQIGEIGGSFKRIRRRLKDTQKRKQSKSKHRRTLKIKTI